MQQGVNSLPAAQSEYGTQPPVMQGGYITKLDPLSQMAFENWVEKNNVPYNPAQNADYDMPGFWKALTSNDPRAATAINPNDQQLHFPDYWKTPYHQSFSNESQYAAPGAPAWNDKDQLVGKGGNVVVDEPKQEQIRKFLGDDQ